MELLGFLQWRKPNYNRRMPIEPQQEKLYTTAEVAKKLGMSRQRVHQLLKDGRLQGQRYGKMWLISETEIEALQSRIKPTGRPRKDLT